LLNDERDLNDYRGQIIDTVKSMGTDIESLKDEVSKLKTKIEIHTLTPSLSKKKRASSVLRSNLSHRMCSSLIFRRK